MTSLVGKAIAAAALAHANQQRKYSGLPYIVHPIEVMVMIDPLEGVTDEMRAAAVLHDVLEDTPVSDADLAYHFGSEVFSLVVELTEVKVEGNRRERKLAERIRLSQVSAEAQTIKLADVIVNSQDIAANDPDFANVYLVEQWALVQVLTRGHPSLQQRAKEVLLRGYDSLKLPR